MSKENGSDLFSNNDSMDMPFSAEKHVQISPITLIFDDREEEAEFRSKLHTKSKKINQNMFTPVASCHAWLLRT